MKNSSRQKQIMIKIWKRLSGYRILIGVSILLAAASVAGTLYLPVLIGRAIDAMIIKGHVDFTVILDLLQRAALVAGATGICQWIMNLCNNKAAFHVTRDLRNEAMDKIEKLPLSYIDRKSHGDLVSRIITDVDQVADGLLLGFSQFFTGLITILATIGFIFSIHPGIALLVILLTPLSLFVARFISRKTFDMFALQSETRGKQTSFIQEIIDGQKVVKAFGYEKRALERFARVNDRLKDYSIKAIFYSSITNPSTRFVNSLVYTGVAFTGALTVIAGNLTVGSLTCLLSYANQYTKPFNEISGVITELQNAIACAGRILDLIEEEPERETGKALDFQAGKGEVSLSHVDFSYLPDRPLIENLNLDIRGGQRIAIVGPTGSGKTTLINLLMRFYDVKAGTIHIDGVEIRDMTRQSLRKNFGMVLQDTWLKTGTIRDNILMGREGFSDQEVEEAARRSHAYDFIKKMPQGFSTVISDESTAMSQGQKQLLCISRIMLQIPAMLILDEATSSIDTRTEMLIQKAFSVMMEGRTSFIVAHRLSTIEQADCILVMKDGHIIEQGKHKTLLEAEGFYANLYNSQFS